MSLTLKSRCKVVLVTTRGVVDLMIIMDSKAGIATRRMQTAGPLCGKDQQAMALLLGTQQGHCLAYTTKLDQGQMIRMLKLAAQWL